MKKFACILLVIAIALTPVCVFAAEYFDPQNLLSIQYDDPSADNGLYYYISESDNNLFGDIAEQLEAEQKDVRFFISQYDSDGAFLYQIMIWSMPFSTVEGIDQNSLTDDITQVPAAQATAIMEAALAGKIDPDTDITPEFSTFAIRPALFYESAGTENAPFLADVFVTMGNGTFIVANVQYPIENGAAGQTAAYDQLQKMIFSDAAPAEPADPTAAPSEQPEAQPTEAPTEQQPIPTVEPTPQPTQSGFFAGVIGSINSAFHNDPNFVWYAVGLLAILVVVIIILVVARKRAKKSKPKHRKDIVFEPDENPLTGETGKIPLPPEPKKPDPDSEMIDEALLEQAHEEPAREGIQEEDVPDTQNEPEPNVQEISGEEDKEQMDKFDKDFAEDISKYTRQPGMEVNDISRNTMGGYTDDGGISEAINEQARKDSAPEQSGSTPPDWKAGGSRMERRRQGKRKK